jgi:hypothetical protein
MPVISVHQSTSPKADVKLGLADGRLGRLAAVPLSIVQRWKRTDRNLQGSEKPTAIY